jgi:hypothetical protein
MWRFMLTLAFCSTSMADEGAISLYLPFACLAHDHYPDTGNEY